MMAGKKKNVKGIKKASSSSKKKSSTYQSGRELAIKPKTELKAFDVAATTQTFNTVATGGNIALVNFVINGAELYQRTGRKIYMKSLHIRGHIKPNAAIAANTGELRMLIVYDSQPNAALPILSTLLQDSNAAAATTIDSEINLANRARYQILRDIQFYYPAAAGADDISGVLPDPIKNSLIVNEFIKLKGLEAVFNGVNGGTIADITSGALYVVCVGDNNSTNRYDIVYTSRLRYYD